MRQLGTCGDYFVNHKQLLARKKGVHKKIYSYINDEYICSAIITWLLSQNPPQRTDNNLRQFVITKLLTYQEIITFNTAMYWLNKISFNVAETENKNGLIYVDGYEIPDVVAYRNLLCDIWFNKYLTCMLYF